MWVQAAPGTGENPEGNAKCLLQQGSKRSRVGLGSRFPVQRPWDSFISFTALRMEVSDLGSGWMRAFGDRHASV